MIKKASIGQQLVHYMYYPNDNDRYFQVCYALSTGVDSDYIQVTICHEGKNYGCASQLDSNMRPVSSIRFPKKQDLFKTAEGALKQYQRDLEEDLKRCAITQARIGKRLLQLEQDLKK